MEKQKKCSAKKHADNNAISYCIECSIYMCNKCLNYHSEIHENHHYYNLDKNNQEIFTGKCKEEKHKDELEYYCKTHCILCCAACLSKLKGNGNGQHTDCDVCYIEEIKDEKKNKLNQNIKTLEEMSNKIETSINKLKEIFKEIFKKINEDKEKLKMDIATIFTKIRNTINEREDELLMEIDNKFDNLYFTEKIINQSEKLPDKIKKSLEKGRLINNGWNDSNKLNYKIQNCIDIENEISSINEINLKIEKSNPTKIKAKFLPDNENELNEFLKAIKIFGKIIVPTDKLSFKFKPGKNYTLSNNGFIAKKTSGGDSWNCTIIGDKEIPKNEISKWKIRINNFEIKDNSWNVLIGIGPDNPNNEENYYNKCWSFICGSSKLSIKSGSSSKYNNNKGQLKKGDIIEVNVDRKVGTLSFAINDSNYGIAYSQIPKDDILFPIVMISDENQIVELLSM